MSWVKTNQKMMKILSRVLRTISIEMLLTILSLMINSRKQHYVISFISKFNLLFLVLYYQKISVEENFANQDFREIFLISREFNFANQEKLCISREFNFANGQNRYLFFFLFLKKTIKIQHFSSFINQILSSSHS